jgi:hypothetical protein
MSGHTPGPWRAGSHPMNEAEVFADELDGERIAECYGAGDADQANALLIAAAPELLEALERMAGAFVPHPRDDTEGWREEHEACELARAAIAKATGAQP